MGANPTLERRLKSIIRYGVMGYSIVLIGFLGICTRRYMGSVGELFQYATLFPLCGFFGIAGILVVLIMNFHPLLSQKMKEIQRISTQSWEFIRNLLLFIQQHRKGIVFSLWGSIIVWSISYNRL